MKIIIKTIWRYILHTFIAIRLTWRACYAYEKSKKVYLKGIEKYCKEMNKEEK